MAHKRDLPISFDDGDPRPEFERMMSNLERARHQWNLPGLRDYSRVLLQLVGAAATEASQSQSSPVVVKWPDPSQQQLEAADD